MAQELHFISSLGEGAFYMMPRPDPLTSPKDLKFLQDCEISGVVSLLAVPEAEALGLAGEADLCREVGLKFTHFPIPDFSVPALKQFSELIATTYLEIMQGARVVIHCHGGIGRSGLFGCGLLIKWGMSAQEAMALVSARRHARVPESAAQVQFLREFELARGGDSSKP